MSLLIVFFLLPMCFFRFFWVPLQKNYEIDTLKSNCAGAPRSKLAGYVRANIQNSIKESVTITWLSFGGQHPKTGFITYVIINGYRGSYSSPQQAGGVFDWKSISRRLNIINI
jgi:hypothetical protein